MACGLMSEVSALLGSRLTINAADQAHFGGSKVYGNVALSSTSGCTAADGATQQSGGCAVQAAINNAKQIVDSALRGVAPSAVSDTDAAKIAQEVANLKQENSDIRKEIENLKQVIAKLQAVSLGGAAPATSAAPAAKVEEKKEAAPAEEDDDVDLFGSDDEDDEEKKKLVEERLKAYAEKKSKKPGPIAKSSIILDVKPWDDETSLDEMEKNVRSIEMDGLVWGGSKKLPIGYGISKLQIICVVEDLKVSVDDLSDQICAFEDFVQSVDIAAFNKI